MTIRDKPKQCGMSLIVMLVVMVIGALTLKMVMAAMSSNFKANRVISTKGELEDLRRFVRVGLNCPNTLAAAPGDCSAAPPLGIPLRVALIRPGTPGGNLIQIPAPPGAPIFTTIGKFQLRANCLGGREFQVEFREVNAVGWRGLFNLPRVCP